MIKGGTISHLTMETLEMLFKTDVFALLLPHASNLRAVKGTSESKMSISEFTGMKVKQKCYKQKISHFNRAYFNFAGESVVLHSK